ncbi:MAG: hypothetical protein AABY15_06745 [Nanoarchaeota archaeon]
MKSFYGRLNFVITSALDFIEKSVKKDKKIVFWNSKSEPEGDEDEFYDLPTVTYVTKHGFYEQYGVLSISKKGKDVILHTKGRGEDDSLKDFKLSEINQDDAVSLCLIADLIAEK